MSMVDVIAPHTSTYSVSAQLRRRQVTWWLWFLAVGALSAFSGLLMLRDWPSPANLGWLIYIAGIGAILYRPRYGVYLTVGLALTGDITRTPWFPFTKNFSSGESLFYLNNAIIFSPAETYIAITFISWLGRCLMERRWRWHNGPLTLPALAFIGFISYALAYGLGRGGNVNIGLWESRPIFYLVAMLLLASNLLEERGHLETVIWWAVAGVFLDSISGVLYVNNVLAWDVGSVQRIQEHSGSIHANTIIVFFLTTLLFRVPPGRRILLGSLLPLIMIAYVSNQRRAAFLTLAIALVLMAVVLYFERRTLFMILTPICAVIGIVYTIIFWNSTGVLGLPANAIKSVISSEASAEDQASNLYRLIENANTMFTIKQVPFTGVGFGQKFFIVARMPDISFFVWWEYITHNSIMWIWMKTGVGGFLTMCLLITTAIFTGVRAITRMPGGILSAVALTATLYVPIHFVYAYVDMSWDNQSMIYLGAMMGIVNCIEHVVGRPVALKHRRWPWQPEPTPVPGLRPL